MSKKGSKEKLIQSKCLQVLTDLGIFHWRQNSGCISVRGHMYRICSVSGVSDILGILPDGRFLAIECKRENGGRVSDAQKHFLQTITDNGGVAIVASNPGQLAALLRKELNK